MSPTAEDDARPGDRRDRVDRLARLRRPARPGRRGRRADPRPRHAPARPIRRVTWHPWRAAIERPPAEALEGVDGVVNLIGEPIDQRWTDEAKRRILDSRERATKNLVDAIARRRARSRRRWSASPRSATTATAATRSSTSRRPPADASTRRSASPGRRRRRGRGARAAARDHRAPASSSTPTGGLLTQLLLPFKLGRRRPDAGGDQYMPWINLDDEVAPAALGARHRPREGIFNASARTRSPTATSRRRSAGCSAARRSSVPKLAVKARLGSELGEVPAGGQRVLPRRALDAGFEFALPDLEPAFGTG